MFSAELKKEIRDNPKHVLDAIFETATVQQMNDYARLWKAHYNINQRRVAMSFRIGDKVEFKSRRGNEVRGTVSKINRKTIVVETEFSSWRVSPTLLKKVA